MGAHLPWSALQGLSFPGEASHGREGLSGHVWFSHGRVGHTFPSLAPQNLSCSGEANNGREGCTFSSLVVKAWLDLESPYMEEGAQLPRPVTPVPSQSWRCHLWKRGLQFPRPGFLGHVQPEYVSLGRIGCSYTGLAGPEDAGCGKGSTSFPT